MPTLLLKNLVVADASGKKLLDRVEFSLKSGEILCLVGKSGSGKSLTILSLLGFLPAQLRKISGEMSIDGAEFSHSDKIACIMQNPKTAFNPIVKMKTHFAESLKKAEFGAEFSQNSEQIIFNALKDVGLEREILDLYPFQMSGGMLQRAMIAIALLANPDFIVADEPTTDLDLLVQNKILTLLSDLAKRKNIAILLVTHDFSVVAKISHKVIVIDGGKIVEQGATQDILRFASSKVGAQLVGAYKKIAGSQI